MALPASPRVLLGDRPHESEGGASFGVSADVAAASCSGAPSLSTQRPNATAHSANHVHPRRRPPITSDVHGLAVMQYLRQLRPTDEEAVEMEQPVADEGFIARIQEPPHLRRHHHTVAPLFEIAGVDEHADHAQRRALVEGELLGHYLRLQGRLEQRLDPADLERRHEDDLGLPLAGKEICVSHDASLLNSAHAWSDSSRSPGDDGWDLPTSASGESSQTQAPLRVGTASA